MKLRYLSVFMVLIPTVAFAATDTGKARLGVNRAQGGAARASAAASKAPKSAAAAKVDAPVVVEEEVDDTPVSSSDCREAYRACMDDFCLLDESEGYRCACSSNIEKSKPLILEIQKLQEEADKLYTEGVEREKLGAKAKLVFGSGKDAQKGSSRSKFLSWLNNENEEEGSLDEDTEIGDELYSMAAEFCEDKLAACGGKAEMEEQLYSRMIVQDCKSYNSYLADQKTNAVANKRTAESAVRKARLEMLDTTNKYNRGECLLAYRSCIADKGGCGTNFENCLDKQLLNRRANACENVLDQCLAVRKDVLKDWQDESKTILAEAAKYVDRNQRATCMARVQVCLEDGCSASTNTMCLSDINIAAGVCPVIDECDELVPGFKDQYKDKLGFLRTQFCQNDIDKCLRSKCGENYTAPECIGKKPSEIAELCPQSMYPSCKYETQFNIIVQSALLQMDYKLMQGCINTFSEELGKVCGTDMACLPRDAAIDALDKVPTDQDALNKLYSQVKENADVAVEEFFKTFEANTTIAACKDSEKPKGRATLQNSMFSSARLIAKIGAENRAVREVDAKIAELSRKQDIETSRKNCLTIYKPTPKKNGSGNYTYIKSSSYEPSLRNCHVCRIQRSCETGGESKMAAGMKAAAGGLSAGASMGTMVSPGWGTAIGGVVGAVGAGVIAGVTAEGEKEFCQELESCEDINM